MVVRAHRCLWAASAVGAVVMGALAHAQGQIPLVAQGETLFHAQGCYGCHTVGKTGTPIGPDLSHVGAKYSETVLAQWLRDPASQKPTAHMPRLDLKDAEARALAAYLASLR
jgi:cytochrome c oxidase subunit 2